MYEHNTIAKTACYHCGNNFNPANGYIEDDKYYCCYGCFSANDLIAKLEAEDKNSTYSYLNDIEFYNEYLENKDVLKMNFYVEGIKCVNCISSIEKIPISNSSIKHVDVNLQKNIASVSFANTSFSNFPVEVEKLGFKAHPIKNSDDLTLLRKKEKRTNLKRLAVSAVCAGNIMLLSASIYAGAEGSFKEYFNFINLLLALPIITYCSYPFYKSSYHSIKENKASVDTPIVLVIVSCFIWSAYNIFTGNENIYLDSISVFIFLILLSRFLLDVVKEKTYLDINSSILKNFNSRILRWNKADSEYTEYPYQKLETGDKIKLLKDQQCPVDGKLINEKALFNFSFLTGESQPKLLTESNDIYAGSVLCSNDAEIEVTNTGSDTKIGKFLQKVEKIYDEKKLFSSFSDKYSTIFTILVVTISILSVFIFLTFLSPIKSLERAMAFILISCPCAFIFATPLAFRKSLVEGIKNGFVIKNIDIFDKISKIKNIFFDKTGTITEGKFKVLEWDYRKLSKDDLEAIYSIENESNHPISETIIKHLDHLNLGLNKVDNFKITHSKGISGYVNNDFYEIQSSINRSNNKDEKLIISKIDVVKNSKIISSIFLGDRIKKDFYKLKDYLKNKGYKIAIISGDNKANVEKVSEILSIPKEDAFYKLTPEEKIQLLKDNPDSIMIGDGLNDSGAFASADISIAVKGSAEKNLELSDAFLISDEINKIVELFQNITKTNNTLKRNTVISITYNLIAGSFALAGYITPILAAILMPLSSLLLLGSTYYGNGNTESPRSTQWK